MVFVKKDSVDIDRMIKKMIKYKILVISVYKISSYDNSFTNNSAEALRAFTELVYLVKP